MNVCVSALVCLCGVHTFTFVCVCVCVLYAIKGSEQRRPGGRRVMQSTEAKERTRGRQEGREGGEEGGIVASGIQLSRNVLTVMSYTVGLGGGGVAFWQALRR